jgi:glycerate dehydrogenase
MHGVFLDTATMRPEELDFSELRATLPTWNFHERTAAEETAGRIARAEVIVTNKVVISAEHMRANPQLRLICVCATGVNNVDLGAAAAAGITVRNVTHYATAAVAQHTLALMLALATQWHRYARAVENGDWAKSPMFCLMDFPVIELAGKTLGIVGAGNLGTQVARLGEAFGMRVVLAQWTPRASGAGGRGESHWLRLPWAEFLPACDFISVHCPLTDTTRDLFNADALAAMKHGAFLINTARGGIVNEAALLHALRAGRLGGAALDVLAQEPPPADHPLITAGLPNLIITPHNAWVSRECRQRLLDGVARNVSAFTASTAGASP